MARAASERQRRYRDRRRRGVRCYGGIELSDVDLAALIDCGVITELDALDVAKVGKVASQLLSATIKKYRDAST
jgi:hypothetical protein